MAHTQYKKNTDDARKARRTAGEYVRKLRLAADLSQLDMANRLGYPYYTFISQVENGVSRVPPEALHEWARVLNVNVRDFTMTLLRYYDPFTFDALFGSGPVPKGHKEGRADAATSKLKSTRTRRDGRDGG